LRQPSDRLRRADERGELIGHLYLAGMAITLTDRFKAACFGAGVSNLASFTGTAGRR
jgi:hypothetical protein